MIIVRPFVESDAEFVNLIVASCTRELRTVYCSRPLSNASAVASSYSLARVVAVDHTGTVVGIAECIERPSVIYVQGIAVAPTHRRSGIAGDLLEHIKSLAAHRGLPDLELATIKETGNVEIFRRLGFTVSEERVSERFQGSDGMPVTEVTLKRHLGLVGAFEQRPTL
jgi:ribosomal protein S18 acetylase RimI-like enzyme